MADGLRDQAHEQLLGADEFLKQLLAAMQTGALNFYTHVYAIKARVKSEESLIKKVVGRQKKNPNYRPGTATDIVGVRILCLYTAELLGMCQRLIDFIRQCQGPPLNLFVGSHLEECVQEVIVFRVGSSSPNYQKCYEFFKSIEDLPAGKVDLRELDREDAPRKYSSIHIVCYGGVPLGGRKKTIPVEFQIRTPFEDVWGEIQHQIEYKFDVNELKTEDLRARFRTSVALLNALKTILDGGTQISDTIKGEMDFISELHTAAHIFSPKAAILRLECSYASLETGEASQHLRELDRRLFISLSNLAEYLGDPNNRAQLDTVRNSLAATVKILEADAKDVEVLSLVNANLRETQLYYMLHLDLALLKIWLARMLTTPDSQRRLELLVAAEHHCLGLYQLQCLTADPIVHAQMGHINLIRGDTGQAIHFFERALKDIDNNGRVESKSHFRATIPRLLAYSIWLSAVASDEPIPLDVLRRICALSTAGLNNFGADDIRDDNKIKEVCCLTLSNFVSYVGDILLGHGQEAALAALQMENDFECESWISLTKLRDRSDTRSRSALAIYDFVLGKLAPVQAVELLSAMHSELARRPETPYVVLERQRLSRFIRLISQKVEN